MESIWLIAIKRKIKLCRINFEFTLSYYIPIKAVDLAFNLSYEQYLDIKEDFNFIFGEQDLIGINITVGKSLIIK